MKISIFRAVLIGILLGVLTFVAFRLVLVILIIATIFKLAKPRGRGKMHWHERKLAYVENMRNMSDDEFQNFKHNLRNGHHC